MYCVNLDYKSDKSNFEWESEFIFFISYIILTLLSILEIPIFLLQLQDCEGN